MKGMREFWFCGSTFYLRETTLPKFTDCKLYSYVSYFCVLCKQMPLRVRVLYSKLSRELIVKVSVNETLVQHVYTLLYNKHWTLTHFRSAVLSNVLIKIRRKKKQSKDNWKVYTCVYKKTRKSYMHRRLLTEGGFKVALCST